MGDAYFDKEYQKAVDNVAEQAKRGDKANPSPADIRAAKIAATNVGTRGDKARESLRKLGIDW